MSAGAAILSRSPEVDDIEEYVLMLVAYIKDLRDNGAKSSVSAARIAALAFLSKVACLDVLLPVGDVSVSAAVQNHRRNQSGKRRKTTVYTVRQVRLMETAAGKLASARSCR